MIWDSIEDDAMLDYENLWWNMVRVKVKEGSGRKGFKAQEKEAGSDPQ